MGDVRILHNVESQGATPMPITVKFSSFTEMIEWGLMLLGNPSFVSARVELGIGKKYDFDMGFNGLTAYDGSVINTYGHEALEGYDTNYSKGGELLRSEVVNLRDLDNKLNSKAYQIYYSQEGGGGVCLNKLRLMDQKELKGTIYVGRKVLEYSFSVLNQNEKFLNYREHYWVKPALKSGEFDQLFFCVPGLPKLMNTPIEELGDSEGRNGITQQIKAHFKHAFNTYYQWFAYIKETPKSIGFKVPIAPESGKELFQLRDLPEGSNRRKAIVHYVNEHYRKVNTEKCDEPYRQTLVKQHLRGETKFNWRGLEVNLIPAAYDINRVQSKKKFLDI